jgi:hypothetical protein
LGAALLFSLLPSEHPADLARFRILFAGFNTFGMFGAFLLARRLSRAWLGGVLALLLAVFHTSPATTTGRLLPEPLVGCFFVWGAYLYLRGVQSERAKYLAGAGLSLAAGLFVRAKLMPFLLILLVGVLILSGPLWVQRRDRRRLVTALVLGALPLATLWAVSVCSSLPAMSDVKVPEYNLPWNQYYPYGFWQFLDTDGWDGVYQLKTEPFYKALEAEEQAEPSLRTSRARQYAFVLRYVAARPFESLLLFVENGYRLYDRPDDPFRWDYPMDYRKALLWHRLMALCALGGLVVFGLAGRPEVLGVYFLPLSLLLVYGASFAYARYAFPVLLILCASAGAFLYWAFDALREAFRLRSRWTVLLLAASILIALLGFGAGKVFSEFPVLARFMDEVRVAVLVGIPFLAAATLPTPIRQRAVPAGLVWLLMVAVIVAHSARDRLWHEKKTVLGQETLGAQQEIVLSPDAAKVIRESGAFLVFDLSAPRGDLGGVSIEINGEAVPGTSLLPTLFKREVTVVGGRGRRGYPQWWALPLNGPLRPTAGGGKYQVRIVVPAGAEIALGADRFAEEERTYEGPSFGDWPHVTSAKMEYDGDERIAIRTQLGSDGTKSAVLVGNKWVPMRGIHRIRIITLTNDERWLTWETAPLPIAPRLALGFEALSRGQAADLEVEGTTAISGFPLGATTSFDLEQGTFRLCYRSEGRKGKHPYGAYFLFGPFRETRKTMGLTVRFRTGMRDDPMFFVLEHEKSVEALQVLFQQCAPPLGTALGDAAGPVIQGEHNSYRPYEGRWAVKETF